jgi:spore coat protein CotH
MQWKRSKLIIGSILLMSMLLIGVVGCRYEVGENTTARGNEPFYFDRVVKVHIIMAEGDWELTQKNALAEQYVNADLWYDGVLIPDVAVRPKGNSSLKSIVRQGSSIRYSLKVDLNFFNSARNLCGVKKLCFNNGFSDPTLIREVLAYELYDQMGIPTPRASFVDLWVNDTHLGLYTMVEAIDKTFISNNFSDNTGNLYKPEMPAAYLNWTQEDYEIQQASLGSNNSDDQMEETDINLGGGNLIEIMQALEPEETGTVTDTSTTVRNASQGIVPMAGVAPKGMIPQGGVPENQSRSLIERMGLKTNENKPNHSLLFRFLDILNNEPDETFPSEIEKVLDVDEVLRFLALSTLIVHLDNYIAMGHNYYLYDNNGRFVVLPWDLNMAFGTFNFGLNRDQLINYYIDEPTGGSMAERPLVDRLLSYPPYLDVYHIHLEALLEGPFATVNINSRIDELAALIRPYVQADELKFFPIERFEMGLERDIAQGMELRLPNALGLKTFIEERFESVREQLEGRRKSCLGDGSGNGGSFRMNRLSGRLPRNRSPGIRVNPAQ